VEAKPTSRTYLKNSGSIKKDMRHSRATISFFILVAGAALASYGALVLTTQLSGQDNDSLPIGRVHKPQAETTQPAGPLEATDTAPVNDTTGWKNYTDRTYFLSFKYPPEWSVQTYPNQGGYYIIVLKPKIGSDNMRIYVSPDRYFAMAGLPTKSKTLAGAQGINVNDALVGVKFATQFYTFDAGTDTALRPQFQQILNTVALSK
jgi:hypothetical protein